MPSSLLLYWYRNRLIVVFYIAVSIAVAVSIIYRRIHLPYMSIIEGAVQIGESWRIRGRTLTAYRRCTNSISRQGHAKDTQQGVTSSLQQKNKMSGGVVRMMAGRTESYFVRSSLERKENDVVCEYRRTSIFQVKEAVKIVEVLWQRSETFDTSLQRLSDASCRPSSTASASGALRRLRALASAAIVRV